MIGYIYNENFFWRKILASDKKEVRNTLLIKNSLYKNREIKKKNGVRILSCIEKNSSIYNLQNNLRTNFLNYIPVPENVKGFVPGHSYRDFLVGHINQKFFLRLDIKNFFDNITSALIKEIFNEYFKIENDDLNKELLEIFTEIVTLDNVLPQGGITSPIISNIVFRRLDIRISRYCKRFGIKYTRYADDLLFSSKNVVLHNSFFIKKIAYILKDYNFQINSSKIKKATNYISLNGFVIKDTISLSRTRKNDISKILFLIEKNKSLRINNILMVLNSEQYLFKNYKFDNIWDLINYLVGYRSFLIGWICPTEINSKNNIKLKNLIERVEVNVDFLLKYT